MYHAIRRADRTLLWLNIFFFMFVSLLPFSTSVLNAFSEAFIAPLFFGANLAIIGWILFFQWRYANSQPNMLADFRQRRIPQDGKLPHAHRSRGDNADRVHLFLERGDQPGDLPLAPSSVHASWKIRKSKVQACFLGDHEC